MDEKQIKKIIQTQIAPLLIGIRNDLEENKNAIGSEQELEVKVFRGKKGEKGDKGVDGFSPVSDKDFPSQKTVEQWVRDSIPKKGKDYFTESEIKEIAKTAVSLIPKPKNGKNGKVDYKLVKEMINEKLIENKNFIDSTIDSFYKEVAIKYKRLTAGEIRDELESLRGNSRLDAKAIKGLEKYVTNYIVQSGGGAGGVSSFIRLNDTPSSYSSSAMKGIRVNATEDGLEFYDVVDTDEKVKFDAGDTSAGYLSSKFVAGTGITLAEGTGANENKLVITNSGVISEVDPVFTSWESSTNYLVSGDNISALTNDVGYITASALSPYLLASGATTGATSQAQAFTNGIITGKIYPSADSTTAIQILKADGTTNIATFNTTNGYFGLGITPTNPFHISTTSTIPLNIVSSDTNTLLLRSTKTGNAATAQVQLQTVNRSMVFASTDQASGVAGWYDGTAGAWRMAIIHTSGNVDIGGGIATSYKLNVAGTTASTLFLSGNGTVGGPAFSFTGDTNTGMYNLSADVLGFATAGATRMQIGATGEVAIGTSPNTAIVFRVTNANTQLAAAKTGIYIDGVHTLSADNSVQWRGNYSGPAINQASFNATAAISSGGAIPAFYALPQATGASGTVTNVTGYFASPRNTGAGIVSDLIGYSAGAGLNTGGGTVTRNYGFYTADQTVGATNYGYYSVMTAGTGKWAFYSAGDAQNYLAGNLGIGVTVSLAKLHVTATTEQSRLSYDASNYLSTTVGSTGSITYALTGTTPKFTFSQAVKISTLTSGRIPFATTGGELIDDSDLTFATDTLTATKIVGTTSIKVGTVAGFISSDGSTGATGSFTTVDLKTVTVKDGIITSIV